MFRDVIRPRMALLDSEDIALAQLKRAAKLQTGVLSHLPMEDHQADAVFAMLDAQQ